MAVVVFQDVHCTEINPCVAMDLLQNFVNAFGKMQKVGLLDCRHWVVDVSNERAIVGLVCRVG